MTTTELVPTELVPTEAVGVGLFGTDDPTDVIAKASNVATALARVVDERNLFSNISGRKHVRVEGWTLLGTMLGVFPVCVSTEAIEGGYKARVEARTLAGAVVGAAESVCTRNESTWKNRDDYALLSMAQTRATAKALRQPLGFVMTLAGYESTPEEEMPGHRITTDQITELAAMAARAEVPLQRICDGYGVATIADLPPTHWAQAVGALEERLTKQQGEPGPSSQGGRSAEPQTAAPNGPGTLPLDEKG